ncbi:uncharacterized protein G2W53_032559 [Senna tora]|uniref:Uncharacterized protein n=1 Tax=Senna tora TaxID=362788 RepID=A0A834SW72_9FABA|nr:uncharacterized protein G2W53_032559 [Senna tora]
MGKLRPRRKEIRILRSHLKKIVK